MGGEARSAPVGVAKTGARTRGQNPLVIYIEITVKPLHTLYNTLYSNIVQNDLVSTPIDFGEQAKHIRGPHKKLNASLRVIEFWPVSENNSERAEVAALE
jgi:hypothetical protein